MVIDSYGDYTSEHGDKTWRIYSNFTRVIFKLFGHHNIKDWDPSWKDLDRMTRRGCGNRGNQSIKTNTDGK